MATALFLLDADSCQLAVCRVQQRRLNLPGSSFILETELFDFLALVTNQPCNEGLLVFADASLDGPVFACFESFDLKFAFDDHSQRRALYTTCRQTALDFLPQQR